jgi:integrase
LGERRYEYESLGDADDYTDANGETVLTYYQASEKARAFATRREQQAGIGITQEITVAESVDHYLMWFRAHRKGIATAERIINAFILPAFGEQKVAALRKKPISEWRDKLASTPARKRTRTGRTQAFRAAPQTEDQRRARRATANRILAVLKAILNKAAEDDLTAPRGPWVDVKPFKSVNQPVERFLTEGEAARLLNACPIDFRRLVRGALLTGCRYAELTGLRVADVRLVADLGQVYIREAKSGKSRHIPLSSEGRDFFADQVSGKVGEDFVFEKKNGTPWGRNHASRPLQEACEAAKIQPAVSFHELRHTYASLLAQAGADLLTISKLLGHSDTRITARHYAHLCDQTLANAVENLLVECH